jgi:phage anti-repressor protein
MNELIQISNRKIGDNFVNSVSARELHKALGLANSQFNRWIERNLLNNQFFRENIDFITIRQTVELHNNGYREVNDYLLTLDTAKHLTMLSQTEKAHQIRNYFIEVDKRYQISQKDEPDLDQIEKRVKLVSHSKNLFLDFEQIFLKIGISEKNELAITSNRAVAKETGIDFIQLAELKGLEAKEKFYSVTELCEIVRNSDHFSEEFKISVSTKNGLKPRPQNLNLLLEFSEFQFRDENGEWKLTEKGEAFGKLSQNKSKYSDKTVYHLVWSKRVLENLK